MADKVFVAVDVGASSGRHMAGLFDGGQLKLAEIYRFENGPVYVGDHMHWDVLGLWKDITVGLRAAGNDYGRSLASVGVDTWGVDFGLLGRGDELLGNPYHYRDARTHGMFEAAFERVPRTENFAQTGLQFMEINSLYQLLSMKLSNSPILEMAESLLFMPDLFHWLMTGEKVNEFTDATTSQFYNPLRGNWARQLLSKLGIPTNILCDIVQPGTKLGKLRKQVAGETGLPGIEVVLPGTHDTASAVLAVPADSIEDSVPNWCYISSGTWSLMGVESPEPIINDRASELNFTNEGGVGNTTRVLKNIAGLWLVQECRRVWNQEGADHSWDDLVHLAEGARPLVSLIDPDHASFVAPANMASAIRNYCRDTGQTVPSSEGAVIRCALESLALRYRQVLGWLEELIGQRIETIHIVGGGSQNEQLNQMTADACHRRVLAGPVEATATGNILMQMIAMGEVASIAQARKIVQQSFPTEEYTPRETARWDEAFERFEALSR